jgi:CelD/BcsL family acetyltransferase involved in cellulose biosynthesis
MSADRSAGRKIAGGHRPPLQKMSERLKAKLYSGLDVLPESYSDVFQAGTRLSFFLSRDWFENFAEHIVPDARELRIYGVETPDGCPVAALPMVRAGQLDGVLSPSSLESLANYYTCYFAPMLRNEADADEVVKALAMRLWEDRRHWETLKLQPLNRDSSIYTALVKAFRDAGMIVQTYFCFGNWYLDVAGRSYRQYVESLPSVLRTNIPYNLRRLEKTGRCEIVILTAETGLDKALDDYERVYNSSWKIQEAAPQFIRGLARTSARNGSLRLGLIYIGGEPAAAQLWIVQEGVASIYKIAYDERFAKLSVGTALTAKLMQHVIDVDKVRIVDYLSGEDDYKKNWMSHRREFWGIVAFNPRSLRGLVQIARHIGGRAVRKRFRRMR